MKTYTLYIPLIFSILLLLLLNSCSSDEQNYDSNTYQQKLEGYVLPENKQGISDGNYDILNSTRYDIFQNDMKLGIQKFNYFWRDGENHIISSNTQLSCPSGSFRFPNNEEQKRNLNMKNFHCYNSAFFNRWQNIFNYNTAHKIQTAVVLWTAPEFYREEGCEGFWSNIQDRSITGGCFPKLSHQDDYEDWIRYAAFRFGNSIDHYIVWNEVGNPDWGDATSSEYPRASFTKNVDFHMNRSLEIYTNLLKRTITAVNELDHTCTNHIGDCKNLVYVSLDQNWFTRSVSDGDARGIHWKNMNVLDYIWEHTDLETEPWAVAFHPYGEVFSTSVNNLTFSGLGYLSTYQKNKIEKANPSKFWLDYPQSRIFASEQHIHVHKEFSQVEKAKFICEAHHIAIEMPEVIGVTHNHFQDDLISGNQTFSTLLPPTAPDFSDASVFETYNAYLSTSSDLWKKSNEHYCCITYKLGCTQ